MLEMLLEMSTGPREGGHSRADLVSKAKRRESLCHFGDLHSTWCPRGALPMNSARATALSECQAKQLSCPTSEESLSHCICSAPEEPRASRCSIQPLAGEQCPQGPQHFCFSHFPSASQTLLLPLSKWGLGTMSGTPCPLSLLPWVLPP